MNWLFCCGTQGAQKQKKVDEMATFELSPCRIPDEQPEEVIQKVDFGQDSEEEELKVFLEKAD